MDWGVASNWLTGGLGTQLILPAFTRFDTQVPRISSTSQDSVGDLD